MQDMLDTIRNHSNYTIDEFPSISIPERILHAISQIPREEFVPDSQKPFAYEDTPLRIGFGQTISQPFIVALMIALLDPKPTDRILEIGTGSGYNSAVLSKLVNHLYSVEIIPELLENAKIALKNQGISNITLKNDDGNYGWQEYAPFDGIIVTAAAPNLPEHLVGQLKVGSKMIVPIEKQACSQILSIIEKTDNNEIKEIETIGVMFVPLVRKN